MTIQKIGAGQALPPAVAINLAPGQTWLLPSGQGIVSQFGSVQQGFTGFILSGQYQIQMGPFTSLQMFDATLQTWRGIDPAIEGGATVSSDGTNYRLANTTGAIQGVRIQTPGTGLTNGFNTVTCTPSAGGGTFNTIVGGAINPTLQIVAAGTLYTQRPIIVVNPPANQGAAPYILPTVVTTITGGIIATATVTNVGAGLVGQPTFVVINGGVDTTGSGGSLAATAALTGSGTLTACYTTGNYGTVGLTAVATLSFSPASTITATAIMNFTVTGGSVIAIGAGYGNAQPAAILTAGAIVTTTAGLLGGNSYMDTGLVSPRNVSIQMTSTAAGALGTAANVAALTIHDGGFGFQLVPNLFIIPGGTSVAVTTNAQITALVGGQNDVSLLINL